MYKKYTHLLTLSTFLAVSLVSCKDKEMYDISISQDAPALVDGHLKFSSLNAFQAFIKSNQDKTVEQLMQMNKDMSFVSHLRLSSEPGVKAPRPVYPSTLHCLNTQKALTAKTLVAKTTGATTNSFGAGDGQSNEPVDYMPPVDLIGVDIVDPLLDSVLDENRELGINSIIYRAGNDYCFFYPVGHPELIDDFYAKVDSGEINIADTELHAFGDLIVQRTNFIINPSPEYASATSSIPFFGNRSVEDTKKWDGDNNHRIENQIWQGNWFLYASSGIKTHATQYARKWVFFYGWVDFKTDRVSANANVTYTIPVSAGGNGTQSSATALDVAETNAAVAVKRFDYRTAIIGYTNQGSGVIKTLAALLSDMTVTVDDPRATVKGATLTLSIDELTSVHRGLWGTRTVTQTLTW